MNDLTPISDFNVTDEMNDEALGASLFRNPYHEHVSDVAFFTESENGDTIAVLYLDEATLPADCAVRTVLIDLTLGGKGVLVHLDADGMMIGES